MREFSFFQKVRLKTRGRETAERWVSHLQFPKATVEEATKARKVLRGVMEMAFLDGATESTDMESGVQHLLSRVHETTTETDETKRSNADRNLAETYRLGYRKGIEAGMML